MPSLPPSPQDLLTPWLGEFRDPEREARFREDDFSAGGRVLIAGAITIAVAVAVAGAMDLVRFAQCPYDWKT